MALPPKFKGHRLTFSDAAAPSAEPLHTIEVYIDYVCPFSASTSCHPNHHYLKIHDISPYLGQPTN